MEEEYDGGYSDPDYYDLEFRRQNPGVYGNDEYMQAYHGRSRYSQGNKSTRRSKSRKADGEFSQEYLKWKRKHPERIAALRAKSDPPRPVQRNHQSGSVWPNIIAGLIIYPLLIWLLIESCGE